MNEKELLVAKELNMGGGGLSLDALELALKILSIHGEVRIYNCSGVPSLFELGAQLQSIASQEQTPKV